MKEISFKLTYILYANPQTVFNALTKSSSIEKWGGGKAAVATKEGGDFEMFDGWVKGKILKFKAPGILSYSWKPAEWSAKTVASIVELQLNPHAAGTEIVIVHSGFPNQEEAEKHEEGWINFVLEPLNDFLISENQLPQK
jgi:uncharacterized protein YndB with AHSA1/START domain